MAGYRVIVIRSPRRYRSRYRRQGSQAGPAAVVAAVALLASAGAKAAVTHHAHRGPAAGNTAGPAVVAFARARVGKVPYLWGGTSDAGMDCSGLTQAAYAAAHVSIERTSQQQWASERHVTSPAPGDLVFFAGSDGTPSAPGHVGIVTDPARHRMIDAYATGTYVREEGYGPAASPGTGLSAVTGFTDPAPAPAAPVAGHGEAGFISAVLADAGAPGSSANQVSLTAWIRREWPAWPPGAANNALDTTLATPGSRNFNTFGGGLHVQSYPTAAEGAQATAATILGGYPGITAALRSGSGVCGNGFATEFSRWSGGGYTEVC